jgi:hypothetical protein
MMCHDVQAKLSLYLYGELEFAAEEALERHLDKCAFCQQALAREKTWHTAASAGYRDVPLDLLAACRQDLRETLHSQRIEQESRPHRVAWNWPSFFHISPNRWSWQLAVASFLVFVGFTGGRFLDHAGQGTGFTGSVAGLGGVTSHIRDIQPNGAGRVRIVLDQVNQREVVGSLQDQDVKRWLLVAVQDAADPGIRVDSVEMLAGDGGHDVRDALLARAEHDPNAAVRLKALEAVRRFSDDPVTRSAVRSVLEHDSEPAIRAAAIDVLASAHDRFALSPELAATLQSLARSERDDYLRARCLQLLHAYNDAFGVY